MATESSPAALGSPIPSFALPTVDGARLVSSDELAGRPALVMFICNHCPYVKAVEDRIIALARAYQSQVAFVAICANDAAGYPDDAPAALAARAAAKGYGFPYLHDESQDVARAFAAVCTPDFFLYGRDGRLAYRGRLDDSWKDPSKVTRRELDAALQAVTAGRAVEGQQAPSLGCSIKWRDA